MTKKKEYIERKESELEGWKAELQDLKNKAQDTSGELKAKLDNQMVELHRLSEEGANRLKSLVHASEDAWDHFREDVDHTWSAFRHSVNYFKSHFKDRGDTRKK
jgi:DNA repair exonuclease SbcCD ATPase subunit